MCRSSLHHCSVIYANPGTPTWKRRNAKIDTSISAESSQWIRIGESAVVKHARPPSSRCQDQISVRSVQEEESPLQWQPSDMCKMRLDTNHLCLRGCRWSELGRQNQGRTESVQHAASHAAASYPRLTLWERQRSKFYLGPSENRRICQCCGSVHGFFRHSTRRRQHSRRKDKATTRTRRYDGRFFVSRF